MNKVVHSLCTAMVLGNAQKTFALHSANALALASVGIAINGVLIFDNEFLKTRNYDVELLATWRATNHLAFDFQRTFSRSGHERDGFVESATGEAIPIDGKRPVRQPEEIASITARYSFHFAGERRAEVFVTNAYTGRRASDIANTVWLPSYNVVNLGVIRLSKVESGLATGRRTGVPACLV